MKTLSTILLLLTCLAARAQNQYLLVAQIVTNDVALFPPIEIVESVVNVADATNRLAALQSDPDFLGDDIAFRAEHDTHTHNGAYWPHPTVTCQRILLEEHHSKKDGLECYVEFESDRTDNSELATFYRLKCEKESDVAKLKTKCEARCGEPLKVKDRKLKL